MTLRAVVIGTGWAGEGHTIALRAAGVNVVAICGRTPEPAKAMAHKLAIDDLRFDWKLALTELRPDIVSIATTAAPHREMAEFAARLGCHLVCDKPLGINAPDARAMLVAVEQAEVKHAYASTSRYTPGCLYARQLVSEGLIGPVREIESMNHMNLSPLLAYSWIYSLAQGGGVLNNVFTHKLGQALYITGATVLAVAGEARILLEQAPVGEAIHDFRELFDQIVTPDQNTEWRAVDADLAYTVMAQMQMPDGTQASGLFTFSGMAVSKVPAYMALYGERGTLHLSGNHGPERIEHYDLANGEWVELPVPPHIIASLPQIDDDVQRDWNQLFREFVTDIQGEGNAGYLTFYDGWLHQEVIDIVRSGHGSTHAGSPDDRYHITGVGTLMNELRSRVSTAAPLSTG